MEANDGFCRNQVCDDEIASRAVSLMEIQAVVTIEEATRDLDAEKAFQEFNREGMELYSNDSLLSDIEKKPTAYYSRFLVSKAMVTGPSFTSETCMLAAKTPVFTG